MGVIITVLKIVIILGFLVLIHETGHFLVARLCKIKVKEFSIGFGPLIWKKETSKTKYSIRLIPLGGYVNMLGEVYYFNYNCNRRLCNRLNFYRRFHYGNGG